MKTKLERGEAVIRTQKGVGYQDHRNYGTLTLTNKRLIWERGVSITPLGQSYLSIPIGVIFSCETKGPTIVLRIPEAPDCYFFVGGKWLLFIAGKEPRQWQRAIVDAMWPKETEPRLDDLESE